MTESLYDDSNKTHYIDSAVIQRMQQKTIRCLSLTSLAMSRIHFITNEEVERIYTKVTEIGRGGFYYGQESFYDDLEKFAEDISKNFIRSEEKKLFYLPKSDKKDYEGIENDEKRLQLYLDYSKNKKNPDVPIKLMELSSSISKYCFAFCTRTTKVFYSV